MIKYLLLLSLVIHATLANSESASKKWLTLNGQRPSVIARGGFSGLFPESSDFANQMALGTSVHDVVVLCNLQLTKDGVGICQGDIRLDNTTNIAMLFEKGSKTYKVNGQDLTGWFALDFTADQLLANVSLVQNIFSRPSAFDGMLPMSTVDDVRNSNPPAFWLNVQYDAFYTENKLSVTNYIQKATRLQGVNYISSPEIGFLKRMSGLVNKAKTKLIFVFLDKKTTEPTSNQTYGSILGNLATIKKFASGIVVPKDYIWPVNTANYLDAPTSLVNDAHKLDLEVYASGFANDFTTSYNYSYDPSAEYLQFIDNSQFSVDGLITDFPPTASEAVACFAQYPDIKPTKGQALIITHNGASGVHAGSTDLAYQQGLEDGADIIDCSVQMSKDGVAFCLDSVDVTRDTTAAATFMSLSTTIPEIQQSSGIFSFDLSWSDIQTLQPQLTSPFENKGGLPRNPANKNKGKFLTLAEFLELAKVKAVTGILINIENAAYLASQKGLDIVSAVNTALSNATFDKQSTQKVLIQSDDTSVLSKFQNVPAYSRVLYLKDEISDAPKTPVGEIKKYADAVTLPRFSIVPTIDGFTTATTKVVNEMHAANISVYVTVLRNEFVTLAFDYFADPTIEIATYTSGIGVDGIITEYPATASRYLRNPCSSDSMPESSYSIIPAEAGSLLKTVPEETQPPASSPTPALDVADIVDPPLPAVTKPASPPPTTSPRSSALANIANVGLSLVAIVVFSSLSLM
ncbi:glycerophosphodiester phosphodiesterase GDPDL6 [Populus alba]|uniref:glycerophosphodiester phosphodiesterase n=2 Tax=Populus TaxID=3689 RepID=A0A4U5MPC3_POPAL|nr:glycerophosphodiester phosphodiesterase GDPDL6-like [Populus alba]KAJ6994145.1 glycerophosphodiester phosphodiesterase GDPDL6-like [Populus alba x Populus x berolinensis]TKR71546.1 glycerophosphodiester phosphodiesterase GDPDL6-like [Populus alba]